MTHHIGTLNEKPLHAALKQWYAKPGDRLEVPMDGYHIDIVRGDLLIEVQTAGFSSIRRKLRKLTTTRPIRLVHPIARERWIVKCESSQTLASKPPKSSTSRLGKSGPSRRKSPKRGQVEDIFAELVSFPDLMMNPNFTLEVVLVSEEEVRRFDGRRGRRKRGWVTEERRLIDVVERHHFKNPYDMAALLPPELPEPFLTSDLAAAIGRPRRIAQMMAYCLRNMDAIKVVGKRGNALAYQRQDQRAAA